MEDVNDDIRDIVETMMMMLRIIRMMKELILQRKDLLHLKTIPNKNQSSTHFLSQTTCPVDKTIDSDEKPSLNKFKYGNYVLCFGTCTICNEIRHFNNKVNEVTIHHDLNLHPDKLSH